MTWIISDECFAFASFTLFPKQRTLVRGGEPVAIGGRAFDMLLALVFRAGTVVSITDIMKSVWPNVTVDEANLRVQMGMLRKVLSKCEDATRAIETVPLRGYCFVLPVVHHPRGIEQTPHRHPLQSSFPSLLSQPFGREDAIKIVCSALDERRLVTITGPGGIGKTTVALATVDRYARRLDGPLFFIDLSYVADSARLTAMIADAIGIEPCDNLADAICDYFQMRNALLILDTCEHMVEHVARFTEFLLGKCTDLRILVTSREALRATGEWTHRLPSLSFPEENEAIALQDLGRFSAIAMFVDRLQSAMRFDAAHKDLPLLSEICRRLDGIPLALEFAAARGADLGLREIAAGLDDRFAILTRGRRTALPRHRTLSATLEWSFSLLSPDEQLMLNHLAARPGWISTDDAIVLGANAGCAEASEALSGLFEKSLLSVDMRDETPIYRMLDTTRAYVQSQA